MDFAQKTNAEIIQDMTVASTSHKNHEKSRADCSRPPVEEAGRIAVCTLLSRLLGLIRDVMIIVALGLGADIFFMAFRIPNIMRRMAAEGVLGMAHAVRLGRMSMRGGAPARDTARAESGLSYSLKMALVYGGMTALVACLLWLSAPVCMKLVAPGFDGGRLEQAVYLFRWCLLYLPLASATAILAASLIQYGLAAYAALAPLLLNVGIITLGIGAFITGEASFFAMGVVAGGVIQLVWLVFWAYRLLYHNRTGKNDIRASAGVAHANRPRKAEAGGMQGGSVKNGFGKALSSLARVCCMVGIGSSTYLYFFMGSVGASFFPEGSVSALYIGERFIEFPLAIIASSIGMAFMPQFSSLIHDSKALRDSLWRTVRLSCLVCLPATIGIVALHKPIVLLFFGHGAMEPSETLLTARMFALLGVALPAFCLSRQFMGVLIALNGAGPANFWEEPGVESFVKDAVTAKEKNENLRGALLWKMGHTVWLGCLAVLGVSVLCGWLMGLGAVALGVVAAAWGQCFYLWGLVQKEIRFASPLAFIRRHIPYLLLLLLLGGLLGVVDMQLENITSRWFSGGVLCLVIFGVALGWIKLFAVFGNAEAGDLWKTLKNIW